jgi:hypothetical protein
MAGFLTTRPSSELGWQILMVVILTGTMAVDLGAKERTYPGREKFAIFLSAIEGSWKGKAVTTPVGPRPYDITFQRAGAYKLEGQAEPGDVSTHYWTFFLDEQLPALRFLSTFAGNRQPVFLEATNERKGEWKFNTQDPDYLEVHVKPRHDDLTIRIYLRREFHVEIKLIRSYP